MRRKLIKQESFDQIKKQSVKTAEQELLSAESVLAKALDKDFVRLHTFTESTVTYATPDSTFIHAGYQIDENNVTFNNIEELVIDRDSRKTKGRAILGEMIDAVLKDENGKAKDLFSKRLELVDWNEVKKSVHKDEKGGFALEDKAEHKKGGDRFTHTHETFGEKAAKERGESRKERTGEEGRTEAEKSHLVQRAKAAGHEVAEATKVALSVLDYADFMRNGPALAESIRKADNSGNVTDLRIPSSHARNESKLHAREWRSINEKVKSLRNEAANLASDHNFCKACSVLRRQNAFADREGLETVLENMASTWPSLIYITQNELAKLVAEALQTAGDSNWDDKTCAFMAEGMMRKVHESYSEKVAQILHLASASKVKEGVEPYDHFQGVVEGFYPYIDQKFGLERSVFSDMHESLVAVYKKAERRGDADAMREAATYANEIADVLNNKVRPEVEIAEEAANWLVNIVETNLESGTWVVSNKPHMTLNGDHPDMAKKASHGYTPSKDASGDWKDPLPMISQDNMSYKGGASEKARNSSWASPSTGGSDVFPKLKNPYVPKPFGDYTMKGEKGVDKEAEGQHWSTWRTADVWPDLQNPYVPSEVGGTGGKGYKMKNGKETDLVVDR